MNKYRKKLKKILSEKRNTFIFFTILVILGIIFGSFFITLLDKPDKTMVTEQITTFFTSIKKGEAVDTISALKNSLFSNILNVLGIWLLGISVIGIPIIIILIFVKSFIFGFSIGGIISVYNIKGIILSIGYLFPHQLINIIVMFILSIISFNLSINFLKNLILKKQMDFKIWAGKYYKLLFISLIIVIISSLFEVFISPIILKLVSSII